jgi:parvulin-like peptidyl-prolyl isomerase
MRSGLLIAAVLACVLAAAGCGSGGGGGGNKADTTTTTTAASTTTGSTAGSKLQPGDVALVGPVHITQTQLTGLLNEAKANYESQGQTFPKAGTSAYETVKGEAMALLIQQAEAIQEAGKLGINVTDAEIEKQVEKTKQQCCGGSEKNYQAALKQNGLTDAQLRDNFRTTLYEQKLSAKLTHGITVPESAIKTYYAKHQDSFTTKPSRKVRYILLGKNKATLADTLDKKLTGAGRQTWCSLAKKYSQDPSTAGKCGESSFTKGQTVGEFDKLLFSLPTNTVGKVNSQQYGWFVLEPTAAATPTKTTPLAKATAKIKTTLLNQKKQAAITAWTKKTQKAYCNANLVQYGAGDKPNPDPCS